MQPKYPQLLLELNLCLHPTHGGTPNYHFAPPATAGYDGRSNPDYYPALRGFSPYSPANFQSGSSQIVGWNGTDVLTAYSSSGSGAAGKPAFQSQLRTQRKCG